MVGIPALAEAHLPQSPAAYGTIMSALGAGAIVGALIAGSRPPLANHWLGKMLLIDFLTTWVQRHAPAERLGRVMSVVMFVGQGLFPISSAAAGAIAGWDLLFMLMFGDGLAMLMALVGLSFRLVRRLGFT